MAILVTAAAQVFCPLCRQTKLELSRVESRMYGARGWSFFCSKCKAEAILSQQEINACDLEGGFDELLRGRLVATMGRGSRIRSPENVSPPLQVAGRQQPETPVATRNKQYPAPPRRVRVLPDKEPNPSVAKRVRRRQALQKALRSVDDD